MEAEEGELLGGRPLVLGEGGVEVVVVTGWNHAYRSRHCFPLLPVNRNSECSFSAIRFHRFACTSSNSLRSASSSSSDHGLRSVLLLSLIDLLLSQICKY